VLISQNMRNAAAALLHKYARLHREELDEITRPGKPRADVMNKISSELNSAVETLAAEMQELHDRRVLSGTPLLPPGERDRLLTKMQQMLNLHGVYDRDFFIAEVKKIIMEQESLAARIDRANSMIDAIMDTPIGASSSELKTLRKILSGENPEDGA